MSKLFPTRFKFLKSHFNNATLQCQQAMTPFMWTRTEWENNYYYNYSLQLQNWGSTIAQMSHSSWA